MVTSGDTTRPTVEMAEWDEVGQKVETPIDFDSGRSKGIYLRHEPTLSRAFRATKRVHEMPVYGYMFSCWMFFLHHFLNGFFFFFGRVN